MEDLKPGDVVVLNSGGPRMTLVGPVHNGVPSDPQVRCMWFRDVDGGGIEGEAQEIQVSFHAIRRHPR